MIRVIVESVLRSAHHASLSTILKSLFDLTNCRLVVVLEVFLPSLVRLLLLLEISLTDLTNVKLFKLAPAGDTQAAHVLGLVDMHLDGRVQAFKEAAGSCIDPVTECLPDQSQPGEGYAQLSHCLWSPLALAVR